MFFLVLVVGILCHCIKRSIPGGGGYSHILAIQVCAAGKGMVYKPFSQV